MIRSLSAQFKPDSINLVMTHLYFEGSVLSKSERQIDVTPAYAADASLGTEPGEDILNAMQSLYLEVSREAD